MSRNTVRRYTRQGTTPCGIPKNPKLDARQELDLVRRVARQWNTPDRDELESELTVKLAEIYSEKAVVDDWKRFLLTALNRSASNWIRARRRQLRDVTSLDSHHPPNGERDASQAEIGAVFDVPIEDTLELEHLRRALPPHLRRVWDVLIAENFEQTKSAKRLGVHRNTIRNAIRQIRLVLTAHGF